MSMHIEQKNMIKQQLRTGDVLDESILNLFEQIPRDSFVPKQYQHFAYSDMQIALPHQQRMMTPLEEGKLLQALHLSGKETILEIGTGTGFLTALLSRLCEKVISIDYFSDLTEMARNNLQRHCFKNIELYTGDASHGWFDKAPYDVIIFTGAIDMINETHQLQVTPGGKLFAIIGSEPIMQGQLHRLQPDNKWSIEILFETCLPPLIDPLKANDFIF